MMPMFWGAIETQVTPFVLPLLALRHAPQMITLVYSRIFFVILVSLCTGALQPRWLEGARTLAHVLVTDDVHLLGRY